MSRDWYPSSDSQVTINDRQEEEEARAAGIAMLNLKKKIDLFRARARSVAEGKSRLTEKQFARLVVQEEPNWVFMSKQQQKAKVTCYAQWLEPTGLLPRVKG